MLCEAGPCWAAASLSGRWGGSHPLCACSWSSCRVLRAEKPPPPYSAAAVRQLGALYRRQGDLTRARSWFLRYLDEAKRLGADFPESEAERDLTRLHLAQVYDAGGYHDEAIRLFTELSRGSGPVAAEAQYGLAAAYDGGGSRRLAIAEYGTFLDRFPRHPRSSQVRQRVEYLGEYTITDADGLALALQQGWVDELTGVSRRQVLLDVARTLRDHQDFPGAMRAWKIYAASYPDDPSAPEARFYLADCLYRLARQRQLEGRAAASDSLRALAAREDSLLGESGDGEWSRLAQLRLVESMAGAAPDDQRPRILETGYTEFLERNPLSDDTREARARALIGLCRQPAPGCGRRHRPGWPAPDSVYARLLSETPNTRWAPHGRFGRATVRLQMGQIRAAIDSLTALLPHLSGGGLQPRVLATLGGALAQAGKPRGGGHNPRRAGVGLPRFREPARGAGTPGRYPFPPGKTTPGRGVVVLPRRHRPRGGYRRFLALPVGAGP